MLRPRKVWVRWKEKKQRWEVGFYWEGKDFKFYSWLFHGERISFTRDRRLIAEEYASHIRARMRPNMEGICTFDPYELRGERKSHTAFAKYAETWLQNYYLQVVTGDRTKEYVDHLTRYNRLYWTPKLGNLDIREINETGIKGFYLELCTRGLSRKYIQHIMDGLKRIIDGARQESYLRPMKFPDYKQKVKTTIPQWLDEDEQDLVLENVPSIHRPIVMTIFYHGLRMIEARTQKRTDYKQGLLTVRTRKGGPDRMIALEPEVIEAIEAIPPAIHGCLFHYGGKRYSKSTLWKIIRQALDDAGFHHISPNAAGRHSFGSQRIQRGQPTRSLQEEMGHSDIRTTEIYTHCNPTLTWGRKRKNKHLPRCLKGA